MREFTPPAIDTKDRIGEVGLDYAFQIELELSERYETDTARGTRVFQEITGGRVVGPKLAGTVYPNGGADHGLARPDGVEDLNTHIVLNDEAGEWLYVRHHGLDRPDGYHRSVAYVDADLRGGHAWMNNVVFVVTGEPSADRRRLVLTYYEAT